jgi:hypothetical protein
MQDYVIKDEFMNRIFFVIILSLFSVWSHGLYKWNEEKVVTLEDCEKFDKWDFNRCERERFAQLYLRMDAYLKDIITYKYSKSREKYEQSYCEEEGLRRGLLEKYKKEQEQWFNYIRGRCSLSSYDIRYGRGDGDHMAQCTKGLSSISVQQLERHIKSGLSSIECTTPNSLDSKYQHSMKTVEFHTKDYIISLTPNCIYGLFDCDDIDYLGVNKTSGDSIPLKGVALYEKQNYKDIKHELSYPQKDMLAIDAGDMYDKHSYFKQIGYIFSNGKYRYKILISGELIVENGHGKIILNQKGTWKGIPAD